VTPWSLCEGLRRDFYRSVVHVPTPAISALRTTLSRRRHFVRVQVAEVNAVKRLLRGTGRDGGRRGSLRTDDHWSRLRACEVVPPDLANHLQHHYAVWRQAAAQVRALDLTLGEMARDLRDSVRRLEPRKPCGAVLSAAKGGAAATPNGRLAIARTIPDIEEERGNRETNTGRA